MSDRRVYSHPPIIDATCMVQFSSAAPDWNLSTPVALHSDLKDTYAAAPSQNFGTRLGAIEREDGTPAITVQTDEPTLELNDEAGSRQAVLGPETILARSKPPYEGWESFKQRLHEILDSYTKAVTPGPVSKISVRYVNRFDFEGVSVELGKYFTKAPEAPGIEGFEVDGFATTVEATREDDVTVIYRFISSLTEDETPAVILDIEVLRQWQEAETNAEDWLEEVELLRTVQRQVFESLITDDARRLFDDN